MRLETQPALTRIAPRLLSTAGTDGPLRIAILNEYFYPENSGGTGTVLSDLARELHDGHDDLQIDVITSRNRYRGDSLPPPKTEMWDGIRISRLTTPRPDRRSKALRLAANIAFSHSALLKLLTRPRYDLLLVGTAPPTLPMAAQTYRRLTGTPYVYVLYDIYPDIAVAVKALSRQAAIVRVARRLQQSWLRDASRTVVLGRCMRDYLVAAYRVKGERIDVIAAGANPHQVAPMGNATRFRARHGLSGFVALYAGNLGAYQDFDTLLDAALLLRDAGQEITFVFVGEGTRKAHIEQRIVSEGITNVRVLPFVPPAEFSDVLASADVSLVTLEPGTDGMGVPSKFYNILASGRPSLAIVGPCCEVARVLEEAECGVRVDAGDAAMLAETLRRMAATPQALERMGRCAREVLLERFTTRKVADRYYETLATVAAASRPRHRLASLLRMPRVPNRATTGSLGGEVFFDPGRGTAKLDPAAENDLAP